MTGNRLRLAHGLTAMFLALAVLAVWAYVDLVNPAPFYTVKYDPEMRYLLGSLGPRRVAPIEGPVKSRNVRMDM